MIVGSPFGVRLWRLLSARRPTAGTSIEAMAARLARNARVTSAELGEVISGAEPSRQIIESLAPALGIRTADMFVIAGLPVPVELAAAGPTSPWDVRSVVQAAAEMTPPQRGRLNELIRSQQASPRATPAAADDYPDGPGALLLRMLRNRNIRPQCARELMEVGGGPYVSPATVAMLGPGLTVITPQYVTAFAHLLGYSPDDMVALTGVGPVFHDVRVHPASAEIAMLAWNARLLSSDQIRHVLAAARA